jgi:hypothetical protein
MRGAGEGAETAVGSVRKVLLKHEEILQPAKISPSFALAGVIRPTPNAWHKSWSEHDSNFRTEQSLTFKVLLLTT